MAEYSEQKLPLFDVGGGNFVTRNKRFRTLVCQHYGLKWVQVGSSGNCFFESFVVLLHSSWPGLDAGMIRQNVVDLFRNCMDSTQPLFERIMMEIECELAEKLVCSNRMKVDGCRLNGYMPPTPEKYCDAVACDGVWVQGMHWFRAVSFLYDVRIGVIIFGRTDIYFYGSGLTTVYLYKTDPSSHFDPLVPFDHPCVLISSDSSSSVSESARVALAVASTPPHRPADPNAPIPFSAEWWQYMRLQGKAVAPLGTAVVSTPPHSLPPAEVAVVSTPPRNRPPAEVAVVSPPPRNRPPAEVAVVSTPPHSLRDGAPHSLHPALHATISVVPPTRDLPRLRPRPVRHNSSSESEATDPPHRAARAEHAVVSVPPRRRTRKPKSSISSSSDDDRLLVAVRRPPGAACSQLHVGEQFPARNKDEAVEWFKNKLRQTHAGGKITCRNSR
jgi:hypothetical protein